MRRVLPMALGACVLLAALIPGSAAASLKRIYWRGTAGGPGKTVFHAGGLTLKAQCAAGMSGGILVVTASSQVAHASIHANEQPGNGNPGEYTENDDLAAGEALPIYGLGGMSIATFAGGQLVYSKPKGGAVSIDFLAAQNGGTLNSCRFAGTARVAPKGPGRVRYRAKPGSPKVKFFDRGGLVLRGECLGADVMSVEARSRAKHATIHMNGQYLTTGMDYYEDDDLNPGEAFVLGAANDSEAGQLIYSRPNGQTLTIDFLSEEDIYGKNGCAFAGTDDLARPQSRNDVYFAKDAPSPNRRVFRRGGVTFAAKCNPGPDLQASAAAKDSKREVTDLVEQFAAPPGATFSAGVGNSGGATIGGSFGADANSGEFVVARDSNRSVASAEYLSEEGDGHGGRSDCLLAGTARVLTP